MKISTSLLALSTAALLTLSPAQADTQDDVNTCLDTIKAEKLVDAEKHRLKFKSVKGNSKRSMTFEAIEKDGDDRFKIKCVVKRGEVLEVTVTP